MGKSDRGIGRGAGTKQVTLQVSNRLKYLRFTVGELIGTVAEMVCEPDQPFTVALELFWNSSV